MGPKMFLCVLGTTENNWFKAMDDRRLKNERSSADSCVSQRVNHTNHTENGTKSHNRTWWCQKLEPA